jgi:hypothetical protein
MFLNFLIIEIKRSWLKLYLTKKSKVKLKEVIIRSNFYFFDYFDDVLELKIDLHRLLGFFLCNFKQKQVGNEVF